MKWSIFLLTSALTLAPLLAHATSTANIGPSRRMHAITAFNDQSDAKHAPGFQHLPYVNPEAPKGGEVRVGTLGGFDSFNPFIARGSGAGIIGSLVVERLGQRTQDDLTTDYGFMAESFDVAEDRSFIIVNLHPQARFSDQSPVTAEDVQFSFQALRSSLSPQFMMHLREITSAEVLDTQRILFRFPPEAIRSASKIIPLIPVFSKKFFANHSFERSLREPILGSGPYTVESFDFGKTLLLKRNPNYWAKEHPLRRGQYNFDRVKVEYFRDSTVMFEAFKGGLIDLFWEFNHGRWINGYTWPAARDGRIKKHSIQLTGSQWPSVLVFNQRRPEFRDSRVREALNLLLNYEWMNQTFFWGMNQWAASLWQGSTTLSGAEQPPDAKELDLLEPLRSLLPERVFGLGYTPPWRQDSRSERNYIRRALQLLADAGYEVVPVRSPSRHAGRLVSKTTGRPLSIEFLLLDSTQERIALYYIQAMQRAGVTGSVRTVDSAQYQNRIRNHDYSAIFTRFSSLDLPGDELRGLVGSESVSLPSQNLPGIVDPAVDKLVDAVIAAQSMDELSAATRALDRVMLWNFHFLPVGIQTGYNLGYWDRFGQATLDPTHNLSPIAEWWHRSR